MKVDITTEVLAELAQSDQSLGILQDALTKGAEALQGIRDDISGTIGSLAPSSSGEQGVFEAMNLPPVPKLPGDKDVCGACRGTGEVCSYCEWSLMDCDCDDPSRRQMPCWEC
jgi:hypothetical protein